MNSPKIGIDIRMLEHSGIGTTIRGLLEFSSADRLNSATLIGPEKFMGKFYAPYFSTHHSIYSLIQHWQYAKELESLNLDLYHMPHFDLPYFYKKPFVVTIHDLNHLLFPQFSTKPFSLFYAKVLLRKISQQANGIICVSENTKKDFLQFFPKTKAPIKVINPGIDKIYKKLEPPIINDVLGRYKLKPGYFLYVGNLRKSKNSLGLVQAYQLLRKRQPTAPPLVLVGHGGESDLKLLNSHLENVVLLGPVPTPDLPSLYSGALSFIFPSFYEGFGLPPLEAMACGVPVVASDRGSIPEICADAVVYVNPESLESMAAAMEKILFSSELRSDLIQKGFLNAGRFSWQKFSDATWFFYDEVLSKLGKSG